MSSFSTLIQKRLEFENNYPQLSEPREGDYIILSKEARNKLDILPKNSIFAYPHDLGRYQEVMRKYRRRIWLERKEEVERWLKTAKERMRNDEIDELFGINDLIPRIKRQCEEWEEGLEELFDELSKGEIFDLSEEEISDWRFKQGLFHKPWEVERSNYDYEKVKERFGWLWGRLRKRDDLISTLTEARERSLIFKVDAVKKLGFKPSRYKPGLFHKGFYGSGAAFLDFRRITESRLKPRFYFTDNVPALIMGEELVSNSSAYSMIGLDVERKIKKIGVTLAEIKKSKHQKEQRKIKTGHTARPTKRKTRSKVLQAPNPPRIHRQKADWPEELGDVALSGTKIIAVSPAASKNVEVMNRLSAIFEKPANLKNVAYQDLKREFGNERVSTVFRWLTKTGQIIPLPNYEWATRGDNFHRRRKGGMLRFEEAGAVWG